MKNRPSHGHRRTESDHLASHNANIKLKVKFQQLKSDAPSIIKCIEESTRKNKTKTILVEKLDVPKEEGDNNMFKFGKNKEMIADSHPSCDILMKIPQAPQKKSKSYLNKDKEDHGPSQKNKKLKSRKNQHKSCKSQVWELNKQKKCLKKGKSSSDTKRNQSSTKKNQPLKKQPSRDKKHCLANTHYFNFGKLSNYSLVRSQELLDLGKHKKKVIQQCDDFNFRASIYDDIYAGETKTKGIDGIQFISETIIVEPREEKKCKGIKPSKKCKTKQKYLKNKQKGVKVDKEKRSQKKSERIEKQPQQQAHNIKRKHTGRIKSLDQIPDKKLHKKKR